LRIDDKDIRVGERLQFVDKVSSNKPQEWSIRGELVVVGVQEFRLANLPMELARETEIGTADKEKLYAFLRRFYGEKVDETTIVKLVQFEFEPYGTAISYLEKEDVDEEVKLKRVVLYADGGSRGNPGPSASGFVIEDESGRILQTWNKYLGITTNNQAEYHALVAGLEWCKQHQIPEIVVRLDSLLVVNQMKGIYKVKNRDLWTLYETAKKLQLAFRFFEVSHVPRELNKLADREVNKALDAIKGDEVVQ
jgi:ribonuclease HI